jgi:hypothetical protein
MKCNCKHNKKCSALKQSIKLTIVGTCAKESPSFILPTPDGKGIKMYKN